MTPRFAGAPGSVADAASKALLASSVPSAPVTTRCAKHEEAWRPETDVQSPRTLHPSHCSVPKRPWNQNLKIAHNPLELYVFQQNAPTQFLRARTDRRWVSLPENLIISDLLLLAPEGSDCRIRPFAFVSGV